MLVCNLLQVVKDSERRKESVRKACRNINIQNIFKLKNTTAKINIKHDVFTHMLVSVKHKVIYCFLRKVASTTMQIQFLVLQGQAHTQRRERDIVRMSNQNFTDKQREYMLKNFYKFMIVRDPLERIVSAYRHRLQSNAFARLAKSLIEKYRYDNKKNATAEERASFTENVRYLIDNHPMRIDPHWRPFEDVCRPCDIHYDFIGSIENLHRDVAYVLKQIKAEPDHKTTNERRKLVETKEKTAAFLKEVPRKYFDKLVAMYKNDHELFGYPLPDYKTLDKRYAG